MSTELIKIDNLLKSDLSANVIIGANMLHVMGIIPLEVFQCIQDHASKDMIRVNVVNNEFYVIKLNIGCVCSRGHEKVTEHLYKINNLHTFTAFCDKIKIPESFSSLKNLRNLKLTYNFNSGKEEKFFKIISSIDKLEHLSLRMNSLHFIPNSIKKLRNLKSLDLEENNITQLPKEILMLQKLESLNIERCPLKKFPKEIYELKSLKHFTINKKHVFDEIDKLKELFGENLTICE